MFRCIGVLLMVAIPLCPNAQAQSADCGTVPNLPTEASVAEKLTSNLEGKAQLLSKLVGSGQLKGAVVVERNTIYQTPDKVDAPSRMALLYHMFCVIVMTDHSSSTTQKIHAIVEFRQGMAL